MNSLKLVTPSSISRRISPSALVRHVGADQVEAVVDRRLALGLGVPRVHAASASTCPCVCTAKSMMVVVPPYAAARVPVSKYLRVVPPNGNSMCVCGSIPPGMTSLPDASMTLVGFDRDVLADHGDLRAVDEDVGAIVIDRGNDTAVFDQYAHFVLPVAL